MTKKSYGRLQRDASKKEMDNLIQNNKSWDDLESLYISFSTALVQANSQLLDVYRIPNITTFVPKKDEVIIALRGLSQDIKQFTDELKIIHNAHAGKTGGFTNEQEMMDSIEIFEKYTHYQVRYDSIIMPSVTFLLEQAEMSLAVIGEMQSKAETESEDSKLKDLQDPNVVSDAVVKN